MWIEEIKNSKGTRYKFCERFAHPVTYRIIKVSVTLNSKNRYAKKEAARLLQEKFQKKAMTTAQRQAAKLETLTLSDVCQEWLEALRPMVKPRTAYSKRTALRRVMATVGATVLFTDFTPALVEKAIYAMYYKEGLSTNYMVMIVSAVKQLMRYAKKSQYIDDIRDYTEIKLKKRPPSAEELQKKANKFLNADELRVCLEQLKKKDTRIGLAMEFIALTGLRIGELLALRVQDYDSKQSVIHVNGTLCSLGKNNEEHKRGTPKNVYSYRDVYLNPRAKHIIEWFLIDNKKLALWSKGIYKEHDYVFTAIHGYPYTYQVISSTLKAAQIEGKHITTHIFRHTHISMLAEQGLPLKAIMQRVGHHNPNTTLAIYTHVTDAMAEAARRKIDMLSV